MGLLLTQNVPVGTGELIRVETLPLKVEPTSQFEEAKAALAEMIEGAGTLVESIQTDDQYNQGIKMLQSLKQFNRNLEAGIKPLKDLINSHKDRVMELQHELDVPAKRLQDALSRETARYQLAKEEAVRKENDRLAREAERQRQEQQHEADIKVLLDEVAAAQLAGSASNATGQPETAQEIERELRPITNMLKVPSMISNPIEVATRLRQVVALAQQHEQARIAAAELKAQGDKRGAAKILRASEQLEAPEVEEVVSEQVQVMAPVLRQPDLYQAKGSSVRQRWIVSAITDPGRVCVEHPELCIPSEAKLNDLAKRINARPNIPGVTWELDTRTIGVR